MQRHDLSSTSIGTVKPDQSESSEPQFTATSAAPVVASGPSSEQDVAKADGLVWEEPARSPNRNGTRCCFRSWTAGRWARVAVVPDHSNSSHYIQRIKNPRLFSGNQRLMLPGRWEAVSRKIYEGDDQGKVGVFARYLGPEESK